MSISMNDVRAHLNREEPDYRKAAEELGLGAIPFLLEIVRQGDVMLASKAAYLASVIGGNESAAVLEAAAKNLDPVVRVAAASGLKNLPVELAGKVLDSLLDDRDLGVRRITLNAISAIGSSELASKVERIAKSDPEDLIREAASVALKRLR